MVAYADTYKQSNSVQGCRGHHSGNRESTTCHAIIIMPTLP